MAWLYIGCISQSILTLNYKIIIGVNMPRVVHFEINADDAERAVKFYSQVFGWKIKKWEGPMDYWLVSTGEGSPGIDGGLMKRMNPSATTVNTVDVPSVDEFLVKITKNGGQIVMPKRAVPGVGWMAYCQDTEGNVFGIMQEDSSAR
jgi:hypothetical protein